VKLRLACAACVLALGCGAAAPTSTRARVEIVRQEQTADKLFARGLAFAEIGDLTRSEQYLVSALDRGAEPRRALPALLRVCIAANRHRAAIVYAREYGENLSHDAQFGFVLALLESALGDHDAALEHLRSAVRDAPEHAGAHYQLAAQLEQRNGGDAEILHHWREYLRLAPDGPHAEEARAALRVRCGTDACVIP
jgi:tetratricopeptide (TPR) repeat protein